MKLTEAMRLKGIENRAWAVLRLMRTLGVDRGPGGTEYRAVTELKAALREAEATTNREHDD